MADHCEALALMRSAQEQLGRAIYLAEVVDAEFQRPLFWVRRHPDGTLTDEVLPDAVIEDVRKQSGAWLPLALVRWERSGGSVSCRPTCHCASGQIAGAIECQRDSWPRQRRQALSFQADVSEPDDPADEFLIQDSRSCVGNCMLWWGPDGRGYTSDITKAGRYTLAKALAQHRERPTDIPWPLYEMAALARPRVDMQDLPRTYAQQAEALAARCTENGA